MDGHNVIEWRTAPQEPGASEPVCRRPAALHRARRLDHDALPYDGDDLEALAGLVRYHDWIVEGMSPYLHGRGIEFGAGTGTISHRLLPHLDQIDLVEPSAQLTQRLRERFADAPGVVVHGDTLEAFVDRAPDAAYDSIILVNVLEHIEDDTAAAAACHRILRPGGIIAVFVPALPFLFSAFDRKVGHHRRYTLPGMRRLLTTAGFDILASRYMDLLGVLPWWLVNTLGGSTEIDADAAQLYDRFGIPATRALEQLVSPPLGKNVIAIAGRPHA